MCGIAGIININRERYPNLNHHLNIMNEIQIHRGPDDGKTWIHQEHNIGFAHRRLSIIDIDLGMQPMKDQFGNVIVFNGEIYNHIELRNQLKLDYKFLTNSDTEVILASYLKWGIECVNYLMGMFAFVIWDERNKKTFCARDRFGIKPFYFTLNKSNFFFGSEAKTILPFVDDIETDLEGLKDYFTFQFTLGEKTLFKNIKQLLPGFILTIENNKLNFKKYWEVEYNIDYYHTKKFFQEKLIELFDNSVKLHLRSDVQIGAYLSGGIDSSLIAILANKLNLNNYNIKVFNGKFSFSSEYDESEYAKEVSLKNNLDLHEIDIQPLDFIENIKKIIYHLDYPIAGPGSFPQFMVSKLAKKHVKVVLGGQGGDEIFGGYARYLLAYFEQCIKGAIEGTMNNGNFIVTYESIIPNLTNLKSYIPLMKEFWKEGLFDDKDIRYLKLISKSNLLKEDINWNIFNSYTEIEYFKEIFYGNNLSKASYFDNMTHFDFKTLLPSLLHVEDRMSMAHGIESRVPFLDHKLIEFAATIPSNIKFENGDLKHLLKNTFNNILPEKILNRKDKMGFPVPLAEWMHGDLHSYIKDIFSSINSKKRIYLNSNFDINKLIELEGKFSRKLWGLLSLEIWQQEYHDQSSKFKKLIK
jgi:asparagine synthase (glutamine-hydrolysing)